MTCDGSHPRAYMLTPEDYWACEHPERTYDYDHSWFDEDCRSCMVALGAAAVNCPGSRIVEFWSRRDVSLDEAYEKWRHPHGLPELPERVR